MLFKQSVGSLVFLMLFAVGWTANQGCDLVVPQREKCSPAPVTIDSWSATNGTVESPRASNDRENLAVFLTKHPKALNTRYGHYCETFLHSAARLDREDLAPLLINRRADVRALDRDGEMPLHTAAKYGNPTLVKLLLAAGADPNVIAPNGSTPLRYTVVDWTRPIDPARRRAAAEALLVAGADVNAKEPGSGFTALRNTAALGQPHDEQMIELLLKYGADVRVIDDQGEPLFVSAVGTGTVATVRRLLDRGADVNAASRFSTALGYAAGSGNVAVATLLMDRGADVNRSVPGSRLPWEGLPLAQTLEVFGGSDKERVPGRHKVALALIARGADVNARNKSGETMLHFVAGEGNMPAIELLLSHGAAVSPRDHSGFTPLHRAVEKGHLEATKRLLTAGGDPQATTTDGRTPLSIASSDREIAALIRRHAN